MEKFTRDYDKALYIDPTLLTAKSNLNYKVLQEILQIFGMDEEGIMEFASDLNALVNNKKFYCSRREQQAD